MSFIGLHLSKIEQRHYVMNATADNHWYNFYRNRLMEYIHQYGDAFCLVINGSEHFDDAYILPYARFKEFLTDDYLNPHNRWIGTVRDDKLHLTAPGKPTKSISIIKYYNSFELLDRSNRFDGGSK